MSEDIRVNTADLIKETVSVTNAPPTIRPKPKRPRIKQLRSRRVGRNDLCPCGSGKKFKKCCLARSGIAASVRAAAKSAINKNATVKSVESPVRDGKCHVAENKITTSSSS